MEKEREISKPEAVLFLIVAVAAVPYLWWANAFVMTRVWQWYRPDFIPALPFKAALGMSFIASLLLAKVEHRKTKDSEARGPWSWLAQTVLMPWFALMAARICLFFFFE